MLPPKFDPTTIDIEPAVIFYVHSHTLVRRKTKEVTGCVPIASKLPSIRIRKKLIQGVKKITPT